MCVFCVQFPYYALYLGQWCVCVCVFCVQFPYYSLYLGQWCVCVCLLFTVSLLRPLFRTVVCVCLLCTVSLLRPLLGQWCVCVCLLCTVSLLRPLCRHVVLSQESTVFTYTPTPPDSIHPPSAHLHFPLHLAVGLSSSSS